MNIRILSLIIFSFLMSCKKNIAKNSEEPFLDVKKLLDLKNYKIETRKINDSVEYIVGKSGSTTIYGNLNTKRNKKFGWWKIYDSSTKDSVKIEMLIEENKNSRNQILCYSNGDFNPFVSKFYEIKTKENLITFIFNVPKDTAKIKKNIFTYLVYSGKKELAKNNLVMPTNKITNIYKFDIDIENFKRHKPLIVYGYFTESTFNPKEQTAENWDILTLDTIK